MNDKHRCEYLFHLFQYDRFDLQLEQLQRQQKMYDDDFGYQKVKYELSDVSLVQPKAFHMHKEQQL